MSELIEMNDLNEKECWTVNHWIRIFLYMLNLLSWKFCPRSFISSSRFVTHLQSPLVVWNPGAGGSDEWVWSLFYWNVKVPQTLTHLTHSQHAHFIWEPGPPTCHQNGWCLSCINTHAHWHTFLIFSLQLVRVTCSFVLPSPCGDAVVPLSLMFLHRERATQSTGWRIQLLM